MHISGTLAVMDRKQLELSPGVPVCGLYQWSPEMPIKKSQYPEQIIHLFYISEIAYIFILR